jgi:hypothetical protein
MEKENEYEIIAEFTKENCLFTIRQPKKESTLEELEPFYIALGKALYEE